MAQITRFCASPFFRVGANNPPYTFLTCVDMSVTTYNVMIFNTRRNRDKSLTALEQFLMELASIGIYGTVAFLEGKEREIGIRIALRASASFRQYSVDTCSGQ